MVSKILSIPTSMTYGSRRRCPNAVLGPFLYSVSSNAATSSFRLSLGHFISAPNPLCFYPYITFTQHFVNSAR